MKYEYALGTGTGAREKNEDRLRCFTLEGTTVAIVADGMGGHGDGDLAAEAVVDTVEQCFRLHPVVSEENIAAIMEAANQSVLDMQVEGKDMRTTVVALFLSEENAIIAHAGDSRLYCLNSFQTVYRTKDHSVTQLAVEVGEIAEKDRRYSEDRNRVLKSMGNAECKVSIHRLERKEKTAKGFVLCTDGFWEHFNDGTIRKMMRKAKNNPQIWLDSMMEIIKKEAADKQDNYSAITLMRRR